MSKRKKTRAKIYSLRVWPTWLVLGAAWLISRLPLRALAWLGEMSGVLFYHAATSRRHITEVNIGLCFPELSASDKTTLARESFINTALGALEIMLPWLNPNRDMRQHVTVHGAHHLEAASALGRGVLLVGGHFTTMDIISQALKSAVDIDVMYRENRNPVWEWLQLTGRKRHFQGVVERENLRETLKRLKAGRTIWYAADQDYGPRHSVFAPFFGIQTATITATARLARFNHSPVVFMSNFRDRKTLTWSVHFSAPIDNYPTSDDVADATRINAIIEDAVRQHPEQYLWMHRRFKTRPPGQASVY
jgi:KDO2-lipid IV(A) lauroyltransferase